MEMIDLAYRSLKEIGIFHGPNVYESVATWNTPSSETRCLCYSSKGDICAFVENDHVEIKSSSGKSIGSIALEKVYELEFSPSGTYLVTWQRPSKQEDGNSAENLKIWKISNLESTGSFVQHSQLFWHIFFKSDESLCARLHNNKVRFYDPQNIRKGAIYYFDCPGSSQISLSPSIQNYFSVFFPEKNAAPGSIKVFEYPSWQLKSQKSFFKCDKALFKWNQLGTSLLVLTQTEVDNTNKSYYGETNLYLMNLVCHVDCRVELLKEGPIHDVCWSPDSKEFAVVCGFMPSITTIYSHTGKVLHNLFQGPRNTFKYSPHGNYFFLAGFGNLQGTLDVYQRSNNTKIASIEAANSTVCEWSPDSLYILTAITSPRLRVDNGIKIWHYTGRLLYCKEFNDLYQIFWSSKPPSNFKLDKESKNSPVIHPSAVSFSKPLVKPVGAYRPPGARSAHGTVVSNMISAAMKNYSPSFDIQVSSGQPASRSIPGLSSRSIPGLSAKTIPGLPSKTISDQTDKRRKAIVKKLKEIDDLKVKKLAGLPLVASQLLKIDTEQILKQELENLSL